MRRRDSSTWSDANSKYWVDFEDFSFYRMDVVDVYYVGGFGVMGWVAASAYRQAQPDPLADTAGESAAITGSGSLQTALSKVPGCQTGGIGTRPFCWALPTRVFFSSSKWIIPSCFSSVRDRTPVPLELWNSVCVSGHRQMSGLRRRARHRRAIGNLANANRPTTQIGPRFAVPRDFIFSLVLKTSSCRSPASARLILSDRTFRRAGY